MMLLIGIEKWHELALGSHLPFLYLPLSTSSFIFILHGQSHQLYLCLSGQMHILSWTETSIETSANLAWKCTLTLHGPSSWMKMPYIARIANLLTNMCYLKAFVGFTFPVVYNLHGICVCIFVLLLNHYDSISNYVLQILILRTVNNSCSLVCFST